MSVAEYSAEYTITRKEYFSFLVKKSSLDIATVVYPACKYKIIKVTITRNLWCAFQLSSPLLYGFFSWMVAVFHCFVIKIIKVVDEVIKYMCSVSSEMCWYNQEAFQIKTIIIMLPEFLLRYPCCREYLF
jgi:hypothetical protein